MHQGNIWWKTMPAIDLPVKQRLVLTGWSGIQTEKIVVMTFAGGKKGAKHEGKNIEV